MLLRARSMLYFVWLFFSDDEQFRFLLRSVVNICSLGEVMPQELVIYRANLETFSMDYLVSVIGIYLIHDIRSLLFGSEFVPCLMAHDDWSFHRQTPDLE